MSAEPAIPPHRLTTHLNASNYMSTQDLVRAWTRRSPKRPRFLADFSAILHDKPV
jgi:hypothetical protein